MPAPPECQKAQRRPCGGGVGKNTDRLWQAIDTAEDGEVLRARQAAHIASWCHIRLPVARVVAELAYPAGRAA